MPIKADTIRGLRDFVKNIVFENLDTLGLIKPAKKNNPKPPPDPKKIMKPKVKGKAKKVASILLVFGLASFMLCGNSFALLRPRNMDEVTTNTWTFQSVNIPTKLVAADADIASVTLTGAIDINPTVTANTSLRPINIAYDYAGAVDNAGGVDMDLYGIRSTITQTSSNGNSGPADRGYIQAIRSDVHIDGVVDVGYALYGKLYIDGPSEAGELYSADLIVDNGVNAVVLDESGNFAPLGISVNGSGDVTCLGTGYGKLSGIHINWNQTTDLTVDSCGIYLAVQNGSLLDSGYRVNASGTLTNAFHSYNSSGTIATGIKFEGAHTHEIEGQNDETIDNTTNGVWNIVGNVLVNGTINYDLAVTTSVTYVLDYTPDLVPTEGMMVTFSCDSASGDNAQLSVDGVVDNLMKASDPSDDIDVDELVIKQSCIAIFDVDGNWQVMGE